jgi:lambda family phage holin
MKMPDKDPNTYTDIANSFSAIQVFIYAAIVAMVRLLLDEKETKWQRIALEMALCGLLAQGIESGAKFFFAWDVPTLIASAIGLLGPTWIRTKAKAAISKKIDGGE